MLRFREVRNDDSEILLVGPRQNNGEFDWFPLIRLEYTDEWGDDAEEPYHCSVLVVSPSKAKETGVWERACACVGVEPTEVGDREELAQCEILVSYGNGAPMWQRFGGNKRRLLSAARREAKILCGINFGFAMDRPINRMGTTGWRWIRGEL